VYAASGSFRRIGLLALMVLLSIWSGLPATGTTLEPTLAQLPSVMSVRFTSVAPVAAIASA
jgi:hypothetical protein